MSRSFRYIAGGIASLTLLTSGLSAQLPGTPVSKTPAKTTAPPPMIGAIGGTPTSTTLTWVAPATTARLLQFEVSRWNQAAPNCCNNSVVIPAGSSSDGKWVDHDFPLSGIYVYRITSVYDDGSRGTLQVDYTRPEPVNPASLKVLLLREGSAQLTWPEVPGPSFYQVWGGGLPSTGMTVAQAVPPQGVTLQTFDGVRYFTLTLNSVPVGTHRWSIASYYEPPACGQPVGVNQCNRVSTDPSAFTVGVVR